MQRAIGRVLRGSCRKWRDSDCPVAAGEEVNRNKEDKQKFVPPKHTWEDAITWTTGLILGYQLTHRRRRAEDCTSLSSTKSSSCVSTTQACPFSIASKVFSQPTVNSGTLHVNRKTSAVFQSVDLAPFIHDETLEAGLPDKLNTSWTSGDDEEEDDIVFASGEPESELEKLEFQSEGKSSLTPAPASQDDPAEYGRRFGADLLSVLGAFEFLSAEEAAKVKKAQRRAKSSKKKLSAHFGKDPPLHALELMKKGAELGSARALYNIGVAYDRMNESKVAREYYQRAADLGHPLATYNCAVLALKDGHLTEGYALMKTASDFGVSEAEEYLRPKASTSKAARDSLAVQF